MQRYHAITIALAAVMLPPAATAEGPDWDYIEASYIDTDFDYGGGVDGWEIEGSWNFYGDWAYARALYSKQDEDLSSLFRDFELDIWSVGVGGIWWLADATALYGEISYEDWSLELEDFEANPIRADISEDDSGYRAGFGVRSVVWRGLELNAEAGLLDVGEIVDSEGYWKLGAIYTFGNGIGIGASYEEIDNFDNFDTWRLTLRYAFR